MYMDPYTMLVVVHIKEPDSYQIGNTFYILVLVSRYVNLMDLH